MAIPDGTAMNGYGKLLGDSKELIGLYWDIGRMIVGRQKREKWGKSVVEQLAADLRREFPGIRGFSSTNLWNMRGFYSAYEENEKLQSLTGEIGWTHNVAIMQKCKDDLQREFYIRMTRKMGWTVNVLSHHIDNQTYEKTLLNQARVEPFLREMGGVFSFISSQFRLEVGAKESIYAWWPSSSKWASSFPSTSARCSSTWPSWTTGFGSSMRIRRSASSCAGPRIEPSSNMPFAIRPGLSASPPIGWYRRCPRSCAVSCQSRNRWLC